MTRLRRNDDAGFTLPELLVAIVAVGVIIPPLAAAFATGVRTTSGATERLSASNASELVSTWFVPDVHSAESFSDAPHACFAHPAANRFLFTATRTEGGATVSTGYATAGDGTPGRTLVRYSCTGAVKNPTITLAGAVSQTVHPAAICDPSPCDSDTAKVSLAVTVEDASTAGYTFNLNAARRTS